MSESKALAVRPTAITPTDYDGFDSLAGRFAKSNLIPSHLQAKPENVFVQLLAGNELGLTPMASLRGIHVVQGKPILSADTMVAVVLGRGAAKYFRCIEESDASVTYETWREGAPEPQRATWTWKDAERALLTGGDNWKKYPRAMLKARCKAVLARDVYPDVLAGCYEESERAEVEAAPATTGAIDAEFTEINGLPDEPAPDHWSAFLASIEALAGDITDAWTIENVLSEIRRVAATATTKATLNAAMKPWLAAIEAAGACSNVDQVKAGFRAIYDTALAGIKGRAA